METYPEDLGLDLFDFFHGFASFEVVYAFLLGESCDSCGGS